MTKEEFLEQIKSPKWQKRRLEIMQRDNFTCQMCGSPKSTLNVHHFHYDKNRKYWDYEDWELITLCEDCHEFEHSQKENIELIIRSICSAGISMTEITALLHSFDISFYFGDDNVILNITTGTGVEPEDAISRLAKRRSLLKNLYKNIK